MWPSLNPEQVWPFLGTFEDEAFGNWDEGGESDDDGQSTPSTTNILRIPLCLWLSLL